MAEKLESGENCSRPGHTKLECWLKCGGMEGQGPRQKRSRKGAKGKESAVIAKGEEDKLFTFTCTSDYVAEAKAFKIPKAKCRTCLNSGVSNHCCLDCDKTTNPLQDMTLLQPMAIS